MLLKKLFLMLLALLLCFSAIPFVMVSADNTENVVYVSSNGNDAGNGTKTFPYKTLEQCYTQLRQGGTIVILDKLGDENISFLSDTILNYPHAGKITLTGKDPVDGKKYYSAGFKYKTFNMPGETEISHLTIYPSGGYCFINTLGHKLTAGAGVKTSGKVYFHAGTLDTTKTKVNSQQITLLSGNYSHVYLGGGYAKATTDGIYGDAKITVSDAYIDSLIFGFDKSSSDDVSATINGNIIVEATNTILFKVGSNSIENNFIPGFISIVLNNSAVGYTISFPNAKQGVYVVSTHGKGSAHSTGKVGEYEIIPDEGYTAYIGEKAYKAGIYTLSEGEHIIRFIKDEMQIIPNDGGYINGYEDGTFRPDNTITRAEAVTLAKGALAKGATPDSESVFADASPDAYYYKNLAYLESVGAIPSAWKIDKLFEPAKPMTRGEFVYILYALCAGSINDYKYIENFTDDIPKDYSEAIVRMASAGYINGYDDGSFGADKSITRAEAVTVINRILSRKENLSAASAFSDISTHWAKGQINAAVAPEMLAEPEAKILSGSTKQLMTNLYDYSKTASPTEIRQEIDAVSEAIKKNVLESKDEISVTGKKYYISEKNGDDKNSGESPDKALKSIGGMSRLSLRMGDAVLFERGGIYRGSFNAKKGVTYAAYGEGEKPLLMQSKRNYADKSLWKETEYQNVYVCTESFNNVGIIGFDHDLFDYSENSYNELYGIPMNKNILGFSGVLDLDTDLQFYSDRDDRKLYIYSAKGNPGERFSSIEIGEKHNIISGLETNVTIDNLAFKFTGAHAIGFSSTSDLTVTNCVFSWLGGSVLSDSFNGGGPINYGNAVEIYGSCSGYRVENCWMYQIYDTAITHQLNSTGNAVQENIRYYGNLMEYNHWGIEYYNLRGDTYDKASEVKVTRDVHIAYNIMRMGGFGWGTKERYRSTAARLYSGTSIAANYNELTEHNVFDRCTGYLYDVDSTSEEVLDSNIYVQYEDMIFGCLFGRYQKNYFDEANMIRYYLGDENAVLLFIRND